MSERACGDDLPLLREQGAVGASGLWAASGRWTLRALAGRYGELERDVVTAAASAKAWDLSGIAALDGAGAVLLWRGWGHRRPAGLTLRPEHEALFGALATATLTRPRSQQSGALAAPRRALLAAMDHAIEGTRLAGQLVLDLMRWARRPRQIAWREIAANIHPAGAQSLVVTGLVGFLTGVTLAFLTSRQLKVFGADVFVVNILGIAVWRELGPMLAAILIAGRSGSAMTAQLGVMRVTQELDALSVMGISHTGRLVLPKVLALVLALPLVSLWTSALMLTGGMLAAKAELGMDPMQFLRALPAAVPVTNLALGLGKAAACARCWAQAWCTTACRSVCWKARHWPSSAVRAAARPRCCA